MGPAATGCIGRAGRNSTGSSKGRTADRLAPTEDLITRKPRPRAPSIATPTIFIDEVRCRAPGLFGYQEVNDGGHYMRTTWICGLQTAAREALMKGSRTTTAVTAGAGPGVMSS